MKRERQVDLFIKVIQTDFVEVREAVSITRKMMRDRDFFVERIFS